MQNASNTRPGLRVLLVGDGGREHALAWKLAQSPLLGALFATPGNPGIAQYATCFTVPASDVSGIVALAVEQHINVVVVGPEDPLAAGLVDALAAQRILAFGPTQTAARLESSKSYARRLMTDLGLPGPQTASFGAAEFTAALAYVRRQTRFPLVVKADGLFRGKGVVIAETLAEAEEALASMLVAGKYGAAGDAVVVEEFLVGEERSYIALCDGTRAMLMLPAQDHKRAYDGDVGPNTGGMGVVAPAWRPGDPSPAEIRSVFFTPVLDALRAAGTPFRGALFANMMLTADGPKLLEFNVRFGDPEAEALLPLLENDLLPLLRAAARGDLRGQELRWRRGACVNVVMASGGYPGHYETGLPIAGLEAAAALPGTHIFQAGATLRDGAVVTTGGRVLCVAGVGGTRAEADRAAYAAVRQIHWDGVQYRNDIGKDDGQEAQT
ncbi:MAG TPA: phosphoribosylamine--glycine ligase [Chloroflexota bacterium]|nr:phosphoribosylamine--glycine ligase [Chloroflexota bacterium]